MNVARRFLIAELAWAVGIFALMVPAALMDNDPPSTAHFIAWLARAATLAAFPAGIAVAPAIFDHEQPWRQLLAVLAAAAFISLIAFGLLAIVHPMAAQTRSLAELARAMSVAGDSWESRNDAAWRFYTTLFAPINALLFAAIGVQVGGWAARALPVAPRRALYWAVGLGLLLSGFAIWDTTYETVVLHTAADADFAAFYTLLIPSFLCAGLALPTLALLRGRVERTTM